MSFSAFNHLYGLFATISSALVGFEVAQEYLADRFKERLDKFRERIDAVEKRITSIQNDATNIIKEMSARYDGKVPQILIELALEVGNIGIDFDHAKHPDSHSNMDKGGATIAKTADKFKNNLSNGFWLRDPKDEQDLVKRICSNLGVLAFLFCTMMLVLAGFQDMGFNNGGDINHNFYFKMVADFELTLIAITIIVILFYTFHEGFRDYINVSRYGRVLVLFLAITVFSSILASLPIGFLNWLPWFGVVYPAWIFVFSFILGFFPFIGLICRYFIYLEFLYTGITRKFSRLESRLVEAEKKLKLVMVPE
jgi:hypothetical protein